MADLSRLNPGDCSCRDRPLAVLVARWSASASERLAAAISSGLAVNFEAVKKEAALVASIGRKGPMAFAPENTHYGHFCDTCPYRAKTPLRETLAVDPRTPAR